MRLFKHNEEAYRNTEVLFKNHNKVAIIHPTGTGKSFVGLEFCVQNPLKTVCWLSPSEYIYKTQLENWIEAGGSSLENVSFFTYSKLMILNYEELEKIKPDYIILDEFHRCGAQMWGQGVDNLLSIYKESKVLGLSATHIRYLDNQRNMAEELFDGNIASEMTLGEAIVRGILNKPKYITALFSYKSELKKYENRVMRTKNRAVQDNAEKYLEALRRSLEKAEGLDEIFAKHMEKDGKYIIFCANKEHLDLMIKKSKKHFSKIDKDFKSYIVYSEDSQTEKNFKEFKEDKSQNLRLLFCIDMLNEGVHVDGVNGVILFRPTVSPIIYKQQIGRALSASKSVTSVIFDIVNNFENLYSIGAIEKEMNNAVVYFRENGKSEEIVTEKFEIIEDVNDCRKLFAQLDESLTASWDLMYKEAKRYYEINGSLDVQKRYKTEQGYSLGSWLATQRRVYKGDMYGSLDETRIEKLNSIGMQWDNFLEISFNKNYELARQYFEENGDLDIYVDYISEDGTKLGAWICNLRQKRLSGGLPQDRVDKLNKISMIWDKMSYLWEQGYISAMDYYIKNGNLNVKSTYVDSNKYKLGAWLNTQKRLYRENKLTETQVNRLEDLSIQWMSKFQYQWEQGFKEAENYYRENGNLDVKSNYITKSNFKLGAWISNQREKVTAERKQRLDSIGMVWSKITPWEEKYSLVNNFYKENGHLNIPSNYISDGVWISKWLNEQKQIYRGNRKGKRLTEDQVKMLSDIGVDFQLKTKNTPSPSDYSSDLFI